MSKELKPCPFCGGRDVRVMQLSTTFRFFCACNSCHATTGEYVFKEEAIKAWNKRLSPWHTGTPTEDGWYLIQTRITFAVAHMDKTGIRYDENGYWLEIYPTDIVAWQKIEPYKEN